jgi:hypothetical protein
MLTLEPVTLISKWSHSRHHAVLVMPVGDHCHFLNEIYVLAATQL